MAISGFGDFCGSACETTSACETIDWRPSLGYHSKVWRPYLFRAAAVLLHFEDVLAPLHRDEAVDRLRTHLADCAKGQGSHWAATRGRVVSAMQRAAALTGAGHTAADGTQPDTNMHELVYRLLNLKDPAA